MSKTNRLLIPRKNEHKDPKAAAQDMRTIEQFNPINQLVAGSGVTLTPADGSGPSVQISTSGGGSSGGCLTPVDVVGGFFGEIVTSPPSGAATIDSYSVVTGDRVLLTVQSTAKDNGVWVANTAGAWTRPTDWAHGSTIIDGTLIPVGWTDGSTLFASTWIIQQDAVVDTDGPGFVPIAGAATWQPSLPMSGTGGSQQAFNLSIQGLGRGVTRRTGAYAMQGFESIVVGNGAITLPTAAGAQYAAIIKDSGAGTASIVAPGAGTIDGSAVPIALAAWGFREVQLYDGTTTHWITI